MEDVFVDNLDEARELTLSCKDGMGVVKAVAAAAVQAGNQLQLPSTADTVEVYSQCHKDGIWHGSRGWSLDLAAVVPTTGGCYDCFTQSTALDVPYAVVPSFDRTEPVRVYECAPGFLPYETVVVEESCPAKHTSADCQNVQWQTAEMCADDARFPVGAVAETSRGCGVYKAADGRCTYFRDDEQPREAAQATTRLALCQRDIFADATHTSVRKTCYSAAGDDSNLWDSLNDGRAPIVCRCAGIPGAHSCSMRSSDVTADRWAADGATSFTRFSYQATDWLFDPTSPENRGSISVTAQPYLRKVNGEVLGFFLDTVASDWQGGKLLFRSNDPAKEFTLTLLVRRKPSTDGDTSVGTAIILDPDVQQWWDAGKALDEKNEDHSGGFVITQFTDAFYFDMRFHKTADAAVGARSALMSAAGRSGGVLQPGDTPPAFGVRFEWIYRKCEPGTFQVGDSCEPCPSLTCSPWQYQTSSPSGRHGCRACVCGGKAVDPTSPDSSCYTCTADCTCDVMEDYCSINNKCHQRYDQLRPEQTCLQCVPELSQSVWSALSDASLSCDDGNLCTSGDTCSQGICIGELLQCLTFERTGLLDQSCEMCAGEEGCVPQPSFTGCIAVDEDGERTCGCSIEGECYPHGTTHPNSSCLYCDVQQDPTDWSERPPFDCDDGSPCTHSDVCSAGGVCVGTPYSCSTQGPCVADAMCDGRGGCLYSFYNSSRLCAAGDGVCQEDRWCDGRHGYCPPAPALVPIITPGDLRIQPQNNIVDPSFTSDAVAVAGGRLSGWSADLLDGGSPSLRQLPVAATNWSVVCGGLSISMAWYADPTGQLGCSGLIPSASPYSSPYTEWTAANASSTAATARAYEALLQAELVREIRMYGEVASGETVAAADLSEQDMQAAVDARPHTVQRLPLEGTTLLQVVVKAQNVRGVEQAACLGPVVVDDTPPVAVGMLRMLDPTLPPELQAAATGSVTTHAGDSLAFTWEQFEEDAIASWSGLLKYWYAVGTTPGSSDVVGWGYAGIGAGSATATGAATVDAAGLPSLQLLPYGIPLFVSVRGNNKAGLFSTIISQGITIDPTPAVGCRISQGIAAAALAPSGVPYFTSDAAEPLAVTVIGCSDDETGVAQVEVCYSSRRAGPCDLSAPAPVSVPLADVLQTQGLIVTTPLDDRIPGLTYYSVVRVMSGSGARIMLAGEGSTLDVTAPASFTVSLPQYWPTDDAIQASWRYEEDESTVTTGWAWLGSASGAMDVVPPTRLDAAAAGGGVLLRVPRGTKLKQGETYFLCANVSNAVGLSSSTACAATIIDTTPPILDAAGVLAVSPTAVQGPAVTAVADPAAGLAARWTAATNDISGIVAYHARLMTNGRMRRPDEAMPSYPAAGEHFLAASDWVEAQAGTFLTLRPAAGRLAPGWTYWITLRVTGGAGLSTEANTQPVFSGNGAPTGGSGAVRLLLPLPNGAAAAPGGSLSQGVEAAWWGWPTQVSFSFDGLNDRYAGIMEFTYAIGTCTSSSIGSVVPWTSLGTLQGNTSFTAGGLSLSTGQQYCISVRALSNTGLSVTSTTTPFTIDNTPPVFPLTGVVRDVAVTTTVYGDPDVVTSAAANDIDFSDNINDDGPVSVGYVGGAWSDMQDAESGPASFWVCATVDPFSCTQPLVQVALLTRWASLVQNVSAGTRFFIRVCAQNAAGLCTWRVSDGVVLDPLPPPAAIATLPAHSAAAATVAAAGSPGAAILTLNDRHVQLFASVPTASTMAVQLHVDPAASTGGNRAPIIAFLVSAGSMPGASDLVAQQNVGIQTNIQLNVGRLADGQQVCISVDTVSASGKRSRWEADTCARADGTAPVAFTAVVATQPGQPHIAHWPFNTHVSLCLSGLGDSSSGIAAVSVRLGGRATGGGGEYADQPVAVAVPEASGVSPGSTIAPCFTVSGLQLQPVVTYVFTLTAVNGAGLTTTVNSPAFVIDATPPARFHALLVTNNRPSNTNVFAPGTPIAGRTLAYFSPSNDSDTSRQPGAAAVTYFAALGSEPGTADRHPWTRLTDIKTQNVSIQGKLVSMLCATLPEANLAAGGRSTTVAGGRSFLSVAAINAAGYAWLGSDQSAQVLAAVPDYGATVAVAPGVVLVDAAAPVFPSRPLVLSPLQSTDAAPVSERPQHTAAIASTANVTIYWDEATTVSSAVAYYTAYVHTVSADGVVGQVPVRRELAGPYTRITLTNLKLQPNSKYVAKVEAVTTSGVTASALSLPFVVDTQPPVMSGPVLLLPAADASFTDMAAMTPQYLAPYGATDREQEGQVPVIGTLLLAWRGLSDATSGIAQVQAAVGRQPGGAEFSFFRDVTEQFQVDGDAAQGIQRAKLTSVRFVQGASLFVTLRAIDAAGNVLVRAATTAPRAVTLPPNSDGMSINGPVYQSSQATVQVRMTHPSGLTALAVAAIAASDLTHAAVPTGAQHYFLCLTNSTSDAACENAVDIVTTEPRDTYTFSGLQLADGAQYWPVLTVVARSGLRTSVVGQPITVDASTPTAGHIILPAFIADKHTLPVRWEGATDEVSGIRSVSARPLLWTHDAAAAVEQQWTSQYLAEAQAFGAATEFALVLPAEQLEDGAVLGAEVKVCDAVQLCSTFGTTAADVALSTPPTSVTLVDSTPPLPPASGAGAAVIIVTGAHSSTPATYITSRDTVHVTWRPWTDPDSGVVAYEVSAGLTAGGQQLSAFVVVPGGAEASSFSFTDLPLESGASVVVTVAGVNGAGARSVAHSAAVLVSYLPPLPFEVYDGPLPDAAVQLPDAAERLGVQLVMRGACQAQAGVLPPLCADVLTPVLVDGDMADPELVAAALAGQAEMDLPLYRWPFKLLGCHWQASQEPVSGLSHYEISIMTAAVAADVEGMEVVAGPDTVQPGRTWYTYLGTGALKPQAHYCVVTAVAVSGTRTTQRSNGATVDRTAPMVVGKPRVVAPSGAKGNFIRSQTDIAAAWLGVFREPNSALDYFELAAVTVTDTADPNQQSAAYTAALASDAELEPDASLWMRVGAGVLQATLTGLSLQNSRSYAIVMRAVNTAGMASDLAVSVPFVVDTQPPPIDSHRTSVTTSLLAMQDGNTARGLPRYGYLADSRIGDTLVSKVAGSDSSVTVDVGREWTPIVTANAPWKGRPYSPDGVVCPYANRPGEVPVTAGLEDRVDVRSGMQVPEDWQGVADEDAGVIHGSVCAAGAYRSLFGVCVPCAPGTFKADVGDAASCTACGQHTWWAIRAAQAGYGTLARAYASTERLPENATECACIDYMTQQFEPGTGSCVCKPGKYLPDDKPIPDLSSDVRAPAPPDGASANAEEWCTRCPQGMYKPVAGNSVSLCMRCPVGTAPNSDATDCECTDAQMQWDAVSGRCVCKPGTYLRPPTAGAPVAGNPSAQPPRPECVVCKGRMQYKDVAGDSAQLCLRCPFGTQPTSDRTACESAGVPGMVYKHIAGAGQANKGYCPAGTVHRYLGLYPVRYPGAAFAIRDPLHSFDDFLRTERDSVAAGLQDGVQCYETVEDFDTGDEYFPLPFDSSGTTRTGSKWWSEDARDGQLYATHDLATWDVGQDTNGSFTLPLSPPFDSALHAPPAPVWTGLAPAWWFEATYPRYRTSAVFMWLQKYYFGETSRLAAISEALAWEEHDKAQPRIKAAQELLDSNDLWLRAIGTVQMNSIAIWVRQPYTFFPPANGVNLGRPANSSVVDALLRDWFVVEEDMPPEEVQEAIAQMRADATDRLREYAFYKTGQWQYEAAKGWFHENVGEPVSDSERAAMAALQAIGTTAVIEKFTKPSAWDTDTQLLSIAMTYRNTAGWLLGMLWRIYDTLTWYPFDSDAAINTLSAWASTDEVDEDAAAAAWEDVGRQIKGQPMKNCEKWARWGGALQGWRDMAKDGSAPPFPAGLGAGFKPASGTGLYSLRRTYPKCYFTRMEPRHACVPCRDGTIQPHAIPIDKGFWEDTRQDEGVCTACPAAPATLPASAGQDGGEGNDPDITLGKTNAFLVTDLTRLYVNWAGVFQEDIGSGIREYRLALGSTPAGTQHMTYTTMSPPLRTTWELAVTPAVMLQYGFQPGSPIFATIMAVDSAGNSAVYADTSPVIWAPDAPLPGDAKDANLNDYTPPLPPGSSNSSSATPPPDSSAEDPADRLLLLPTERLLQQAQSSLHSMMHADSARNRRRLSQQGQAARSGAGAGASGSRWGGSLSRTAARNAVASLAPDTLPPPAPARAAPHDRGTNRGSSMLHIKPLLRRAASSVAASNTLSDSGAGGRALQWGTPPASPSDTYNWQSDTTLTDITYVEDLDFQTDTTQLSVTYEAFGAMATGIAGVAVCAGSAPFACDIAPARLVAGGAGVDVAAASLPTANTLTIDGLNLSVPSTVYMTVSAAAGTGAVTSVTSDGIRVDNRPPTPGTVVDIAAEALAAGAVDTVAELPLRGAGRSASAPAPVVDVNCHPALTGVGAAWTGFDAPLGLQGYDWCVSSFTALYGDEDCDVLSWTRLGLATAVYNATLLLPEHAVVFTYVRAVDRIGQTAVARSNGMRLVAPSAPLLARLQEAATRAAPANVSSNATDAELGFDTTNSTTAATVTLANVTVMSAATAPDDDTRSATYLCVGQPATQLTGMLLPTRQRRSA